MAYGGNYGIVVLDKDLVDDGALRLRCLWARMMVRLGLSDKSTEVDFDRVASLVEDGQRALDRVSTIRYYHTAARKSIEQSAGQLGDMASELDAVLDSIATEISR